jgi:hypothetical protein
MSLSGNPVPTDLYNFMSGTARRVYLPWALYTGIFAVKHGYDTTRFAGYLGTISVPLMGENVTINSLRLQGYVDGQKGSTEGAEVSATLFRKLGAYADTVGPSITVDRRTIPHSSLGDHSIDITQQFPSVVVSSSSDTLSIQLMGHGQGRAVISGLFIDFCY